MLNLKECYFVETKDIFKPIYNEEEMLKECVKLI
jgi:hypothetical protein